MIKIDNYVIETDIMQILSDLQMILTNGKLSNFEYKSSGISVPCPFHADGREHNNSCYIRPEDGVYHCFTCDAKGPFYKFVAGCLDKSEEAAKNWLIENYGVCVKDKITLGDPIILKPNKKPIYLDEKQLDNYQNYCHYLQKRKISRDVCEKFNVKYDPVKREILFPCYNELGKLVMIPTRKIDFKQFYLPKDIEKPIYGLDKIIKDNIKQCIITEGPFDCLTAWSYGFPAVATLGNFNDEQVKKLGKTPLTSVILMFDNDIWGQKFADKVKKYLDKRIFVNEVKIPAGFKDINDLDYDTFWKLIENVVKKQ